MKKFLSFILLISFFLLVSSVVYYFSNIYFDNKVNDFFIRFLKEVFPLPQAPRNKNKLLFSRVDCIGVKTGFTDNAGRCLVNACEKDGMQVISVVLNCGPMFEECERLTNLAYDNYKLKTFVEPYSYVSNIKVENGDKEEVGVATINGFKKIINKADEDKYRVEYNIPNSVVAPVEYDTVIGNVKVYFEETEIFSEDLYAIDSARNIDIKYLIENIIGNW